MRVLVILPTLTVTAGAEAVAWEWARYLAQVGDRVTVYATHPREEEGVPDGVLSVKAQRAGVVAQIWDLAQYLKNQPVDVVVALMPYCNIISIAAARLLGGRRPKVVISAHNLVHGLRTIPGSSSRQHWLARLTYRYADLLVAVSHPVGAEATAEYGLPWNRVAVVPNPAFAKMQNRVTQRDDHDHEVDLGHLDLVVPARLILQKRPLVAVDVAATLSQSFPGGVTVHFFGEGALHEAIVSRARETGVDVVMHGFVHGWIDECPAGSIVLLTSIVEGFGNVLVEAAAGGFKSIVSSRCMGAADAVVPGITGELIAGDSAEDYAAAILGTSREPVPNVEPWLRRFSLESSGGILRDSLVRIANRAGAIES